jgi:hypothetical protein
MGIKRTIKQDEPVPRAEIKPWNENPCRVGFWHEKGDRDNKWPLRPILDPKRKNKLLLKKLDALEKRAHVTHYKGYSKCRICGEHNGSAEYSKTVDGIEYIWPSGLRHYVKDHKMIPSGGMYRMLKLRPKTKKGKK